VPDLLKEVPGLKLEVPDRRSGGIRPNLSTVITEQNDVTVTLCIGATFVRYWICVTHASAVRRCDAKR